MAELGKGMVTRLKQRAQHGSQLAEDTKAGYRDAELVRLPLEQIHDRPAGDTRPLNPVQVDQLRQSITAVGLIAPLAVDNQGCLLAGGHRRAALQQLHLTDPSRFIDLFPGGIPCRRFPFDASVDPEQALTVEISENEKRRNYTRAEIQGVAARLLAQGYSRERGRKQAPALTPALMTAFGVSRRTVERALHSDPDIASRDAISPAVRSLRLPTTLVDQVKELAISRGRTLEDLAAELLEKAIDRWG